MKELIPKREQLLAFVQQTLGYKVTIYGELCIAQHLDNAYFDITVGEDRSISSLKLNLV